jgi:SAM-dependent methyltransferase
MKKSASPSIRDNWEDHWDKYNRSTEENPAQNYRREMICSLLELRDSGEGVRLLDIGSGQGDMAAALQARFPKANLLGLELSQAGVGISQTKVPGARFVQCNLLETKEPAKELIGWATHGVCSEVIEHVDDPVSLLRNARRYLTAGARLILTAPGGPMSAFDRHIGHRKHWSPDEIKDVLRNAGYTSEQVTRAGFPFFNLYRCIVIMRGRKLIEDVSSESVRGVSLGARVVMRTFHHLIRPNLNSMRRGWQMIAIARS